MKFFKKNVNIKNLNTRSSTIILLFFVIFNLFLAYTVFSQNNFPGFNNSQVIASGLTNLNNLLLNLLLTLLCSLQSQLPALAQFCSSLSGVLPPLDISNMLPVSNDFLIQVNNLRITNILTNVPNTKAVFLATLTPNSRCLMFESEESSFSFNCSPTVWNRLRTRSNIVIKVSDKTIFLLEQRERGSLSDFQVGNIINVYGGLDFQKSSIDSFVVRRVLMSSLTPTLTPSPIYCPMDLKICPDGSMVGRDPLNNCEFKPCPTPTFTPIPSPTPTPMSYECQNKSTFAYEIDTGLCLEFPNDCLPSGWVKVDECPQNCSPVPITIKAYNVITKECKEFHSFCDLAKNPQWVPTLECP